MVAESGRLLGSAHFILAGGEHQNGQENRKLGRPAA
jgi:hypothetical protein